MIDAEAGNVALAHERNISACTSRKDLRILHADGGEIIDVEEAAVIDLVDGDAPEAEAIGFAVEQFLQLVEAVRVAFAPVDALEHALDGAASGSLALNDGDNAPAIPPFRAGAL